MKKLTLFLIGFVFMSYLSIGQTNIHGSYKVHFKGVEFDANPPKWVYTVFDSTNIGYEIERHKEFKTDGYNMISIYRTRDWQTPLIKDGFLYTAAISKGTTSHIFGSIVQKIDLETGKVIWTSIFDNRTIDKQEYLQKVFISDDNTLIVLTHRRIKDRFNDFVPNSYNVNGDSSVICIREYDTNTGKLLKMDCVNPKDSLVFKVIPDSQMRKFLYLNDDGSYQYIVNNARANKTISMYQLDKNEKLVNSFIDTFYYNREKYSLDTIRLGTVVLCMDKPNEDTLVTVHVYEDSKGNFNDLAYLTLYDRQLTPIRHIKLEELFKIHDNYHHFTVQRTWKDKVLLYASRLDFGSSVFYMDYDGNILCRYDFSDFGDEFPFYSTYLPESGKYLLITRPKTTGNINYRENYKMSFYIYENDFWHKKHTISYKKNNFVYGIYAVKELENKDLLMCVNSCIFDKNEKLTSLPTETWMRISGKDIGLLSIKSQSLINKTIKLYPNPTIGILNIDLEESIQGKIVIYDLLGKKVIEESIFGNKINIDVSALATGTYNINIESKGKKIGNEQFVKE